MRKLHAPVWGGLRIALTDVFGGGYPADKVIQRQFKANPKWGSADRRLFAEGTYDLVRWWRRLLYAADFGWPASDRWADVDPKTIARVAQAWCLINDVTLAPNIGVVPNLDAARVRARWADPAAPRATRESVPDWMDRWGADELGEAWPGVLSSLNETAPVFLRTNRLRTDPASLRAELARENVAAELVGRDGLRLAKRGNVFLSPTFKRGWFEVQDLHSQLVAELVDPQPGERVIDACAGAGGKSLHLAALMQNKGRIVAMDVGNKKLEQLRLRTRRAGATIVEPRLIDGSKVVKRLRDSADRVLLDVPCTGMGILRRNPDAKWRLTPEDVPRVTALQAEILSGYASMCKVGGTLVYSTCSIMPSENQRHVEAFLSRNEAWELIEQRTLYPAADGGDGFYLSRLVRRS